MIRWNAALLLLGALLTFAGPGMPAAHAGQHVWLDSLDLGKAQQGFGKPQANKSVDGNPISLAGQKFDHGFGTHSVGILQISLKGGSDHFHAVVGIDDEVAGKPGTVEFQVVADGASLWKSGVMRPGDTPKTVDVDLTGMKSMMLLVGDAGDGYNFDHAVWADAWLDVTGAKPQTTAPEANTAPVVLASVTSPLPAIHSTRIVGAVVGKPLIYTIAATGDAPITYSASHLPAGLKFDSATGQITGSVEKAGRYTVTLKATNTKGISTTKLVIVGGAQVALTPPMGWNSYDAFNDGVTESEVKANVAYFVKHLQPHGWDTIVIDYRWYDPGAGPGENGNKKPGPLVIDQYGRLQPAPNRFPSAANGAGFKPLADAIHALGLKFGIHIMRGIPREAVQANTPIFGSDYHAADAANTKNTCGWCADMYGVDASKPAGQAWYDSIFHQYAEWGLDFVKVDDLSSPYSTLEVEAIRKAIDKCGRAIVFSTSPGETPIEQANHVKAHANMWRVSGDFWDNWNSLSHAFDLAYRWMGVGGPGHWPDEDMIPVGHLSVNGRCVGPDRRTHFTEAEQQTLMTLWCLLPSPLMLGADLPDTDPWTLSLLTNDEVLAVDQDPLGLPAKRISSTDGVEVWARTLADGSTAVGLFNRGYIEMPAVVKWADLKLQGPHTVRDLWLQKDLGRMSGQFATNVRPHGAVFVKIK